MKRGRTYTVVLRLYPKAWRARYGEELRVVLSRGGNDWRDLSNVAAGGLRERARSLRLPGDPGQRARAGSVIVLWACLLIVIAGVAVQKTSEHWQSATTGAAPAAHVGFALLIGAAVGGGLLLIAGIGPTVPSVIHFLHAGGWASVRRTVAVAVLTSLAAAAALVALIVWAHNLTVDQRNGADPVYSSFFALCGAIAVGSLIAWLLAATAIARRLELSTRVLRLEACLAAAVSITIATITAATGIWSVALASEAPGFLTDWSKGVLAVALGVMLAATTLAAFGATAAIRGAAHVPADRA